MLRCSIISLLLGTQFTCPDCMHPLLVYFNSFRISAFRVTYIAFSQAHSCTHNDKFNNSGKLFNPNRSYFGTMQQFSTISPTILGCHFYILKQLETLCLSLLLPSSMSSEIVILMLHSLFKYRWHAYNKTLGGSFPYFSNPLSSTVQYGRNQESVNCPIHVTTLADCITNALGAIKRKQLMIIFPG